VRLRCANRTYGPVPNLFQLFYQVDSTIDRAEGGLGIGLSLVKSLVTMHGGEIWTTSAGRSQGSEFVVRLPALPPASEIPASLPKKLAPAQDWTFTSLLTTMPVARDYASLTALMVLSSAILITIINLWLIKTIIFAKHPLKIQS
jgi:hypothetical protein